VSDVTHFSDFDVVRFSRGGELWMSVVWPWMGGRASALLSANIEDDLLSVILDRDPDEVLEAFDSEIWSYRLPTSSSLSSVL